MDQRHKPLATPTRRWFAGWRVGAVRDPRDDPADQGPAFGLEMSLLPAAEPAPAPAAQPTRTRRWWQRRGGARR